MTKGQCMPAWLHRRSHLIEHPLTFTERIPLRSWQGLLSSKRVDE